MLNYAGGTPNTGYNLTRSLRLRSSASAYLNRTPASASNLKTWTWSCWVKRGTITNDYQYLFSAFYYNASPYSNLQHNIGFTDTDNLRILLFDGSTNQTNLITSQVFRDPSAWYHIQVVWDTTQATAANRVKLYVNGTQVTAFSTATYPSQNYDGYVNSTRYHSIGVFTAPPNYTGIFYKFDGYLAEVNFIDGQALTPSSFGSTNTLTGVWQPAPYTGTYGTNGFYLPFTDNSALTTSSNAGLGKDFSGNGNYWTTNNISITSGVTYDSMTDVPTLTSATAANFCTWNPLSNAAGSLTNGNLTFNGTASSAVRGNSTFAVSSGKWYFESTLTTAGSFTTVGIGQGFITNQYPGFDALSYVLTLESGDRVNNNTSVAYGSGMVAGDVFICAFDLTSNKIWFGKNGTWFASGDPATGANPAYTITAGTYSPIARPNGSGAVLNSNFGQRPFAYTPPTGYVALNTYNLPTSTIVKGNTVMDATTYSGTGSTQSIVNAAGFKPDLLWIKVRSGGGGYHDIVDSVRGVSLALSSNDPRAENTPSFITSLNSNGFTLPANTGSDNYFTNVSGSTFVAWQWQAGQGTTSSNTNGTITSTVSVNASAGFSVVTYTGTGGAPKTVGHGLGVAPSFIVVKQRNAVDNWVCYHSSLGATQYIYLNVTNAAGTASTMWDNTAPTSSVFTLGSNAATNGNGTTMVAYCFAPIAGYSAFGSYTGNGSADGPFVYTGFRPKYVLIKSTTSVNDWVVEDTARNTYNVSDSKLSPNTSSAEFTNASAVGIDFLSNGFKIRVTDGSINTSNTYVYAAFAENPYKNSLAR